MLPACLYVGQVAEMVSCGMFLGLLVNGSFPLEKLLRM